jgi:hypothetical protein
MNTVTMPARATRNRKKTSRVASAAQVEPVLGQVDHRAQDHCQQGGDHDPGQDPPDLPPEQQDRRGGQDHPDSHGNGPGRNPLPWGRF